MKIITNSGVAVERAGNMSWPLHAAAPAASSAHPVVATHVAIPAAKRRAAAATVASVNRGTT